MTHTRILTSITVLMTVCLVGGTYTAHAQQLKQMPQTEQGALVGLNPQPDPPSKTRGMVGLNPQPDPPSNPRGRIGLNPQPDPPSNQSGLVGLNPQPDPPSATNSFRAPGSTRSFNPQPEPPVVRFEVAPR